MQNKLMTVTVYCNKLLENDVAFGINTDNGEDVFIHPSVVRNNNLDVGMTADMIVMPNRPDRQDVTPWQAVRMVNNTLQEAPKEAPTLSWEQRVLDWFNEDDAKWARTTADIADGLDTNTHAISQVLERMHHHGKLAKGKVYASGMQDSASFCMWAPKTDWFVE